MFHLHQLWKRERTVSVRSPPEKRQETKEAEVMEKEVIKQLKVRIEPCQRLVFP